MDAPSTSVTSRSIPQPSHLTTRTEAYPLQVGATQPGTVTLQSIYTNNVLLITKNKRYSTTLPICKSSMKHDVICLSCPFLLSVATTCRFDRSLNGACAQALSLRECSLNKRSVRISEFTVLAGYFALRCLSFCDKVSWSGLTAELWSYSSLDRKLTCNAIGEWL